MIGLLTGLPWYVWSVIANVSIAVIEFQNRTGGFENPFLAFTRTGPLILLSQIGLFYAWRDAPSFMFAWAVFTTGNITLRILSSHFIVGEKMTMMVGFGIGFVLLGGHLVRTGVGASN